MITLFVYDINHDQRFLGNWGFAILRALVAIDLLVSTIYSILFSDLTLKDSKVGQAWEWDLAMELSSEEWERVYKYLNKWYINVNSQENGFKILSR